MRHREIYDVASPDIIKNVNKVSEEIKEELKKDDLDKRKLSQLIYKQLITGLGMNTNVRNYGRVPY